MYCRSCGTELPDNSKFCNVCGASTTDMPQKSPNALSDNNEKESALAVLKSLFEYFNQKRGAYDRLGYLLTHKTENAGVIIMVILDCILALPMLILLKYDFIRGFILFALLALVVVTIIVVMKYDKNKKSDYNELVSINNMLNRKR